MAGYYYQAEFAALTTLVYKFIIFYLDKGVPWSRKGNE